MRKMIIFGATSAMAVAAARLFAREGCSFFLVGRDGDRLDAVRKDLQVYGAGQIACAVADLTDCTCHDSLLQQAETAIGDFDTVLVAYGTLGDQKAGQENYLAAAKEINSNFLSVVSLLTPLANRFEKRGSGTLAVISSVAGDRGRQSNYIYGAAKGALTIFLQGLRNRLCSKGVAVVTIKPGFVDTPMTAHLAKGPLFVKAEVAGAGIHRAIAGRASVVYVPWFWRYIMLIIRHIPEAIFKKMRL